MTEQLWYTWASTGLGGNTGYQVRAASRGLRDSHNKRFQALRTYLNYTLPQGTDPSAATPATSPVTLAFLDVGKAATPEGYANTHVVIHKVLKGLDANGRPGVFFAHLIDMLPPDFLASDAIDLWASAFWRISDDPPPPPDHTLAQVEMTDLLLGKFADYHGTVYPYKDFLEKHLPYVIRAYLLLKPEQKLYIVAPGEQVALLIWGLAHSLPRSLQRAQNLTFSTYEKEVGQVPARIVGTCRADARALYKNSGSRMQQPLPSNAFTGSGPALALDCETGISARLPEDTETAKILAMYANFATRKLARGQQAELAHKLALANENGIVDMIGFLSFIKTHIDEKELTADELMALLNNPKQAAGDLSSDNARSSLLKHWLEQPEWRKNKAQPALEKLRPLTDAGNKVLSANDVTKLKNAFQLLANDTLDMLAENMQNDPLYNALGLLRTLCAFDETEMQLRNYLIVRLQQRLQLPHFEQTQKALSWKKRFWLLQQAASVSKYTTTQIDLKLVLLWLPQTWETLLPFLETREYFPDSWPGHAISGVIHATLISGKSFPISSARHVLEKYQGPLFTAIGELLQVPKTQQIALQFCTQLLNAIVERKHGFKNALLAFRQELIDTVLFVPRAIRNLWRSLLHWLGMQREPQVETLIVTWKDVVIPVLGIKIGRSAPPINLDELLIAAQLWPEDHCLLIEQYPRLLLSSSHQLSPYVEEICGTFLDTQLVKAGELAKRSSLQHFYRNKITYGNKIIRALDWLKQVDFSDKRRNRDVLDLLHLVITAREEVFEEYLGQDTEFLPNLVKAIKRFRLSNNEAYMENLYLLITRLPRTMQNLEFMIERLAHVFEEESHKKKYFGKEHPEKEYPENRQRLFTAIVSHVQKGHQRPIDDLLPYIQFALKETKDLDQKDQKKFLEPALKKIVDTRKSNYSLTNFEKKVQHTFAADPAALELWYKYAPQSTKKHSHLPPGGSIIQTGQANQATQPAHVPVSIKAANQQPADDHEKQREQQQAERDRVRQLEQQQAERDHARQLEQQAERDHARQLEQQAERDHVWRLEQQAERRREASFQSPAPYGMGNQDRQLSHNAGGRPSQPLPEPITYAANDVLYLFLDQNVTKKQVTSIAFTLPKYVPWRIKYLTEEIARLAKQRDAEEHKHRDEVIEQIKRQQYKMMNERDILEDLQSDDSNEQIQRLLENNILVEHTFTEYAEAQRLFDTTYTEDYERLKGSREYKLVVDKAREEDIRYIFTICMRYCALASYLSQQEESKRWTIKAWVEHRREQFI